MYVYGIRKKRTIYCLVPQVTASSKAHDFEVVVEHEKVPEMVMISNKDYYRLINQAAHMV